MPQQESKISQQGRGQLTAVLEFPKLAPYYSQMSPPSWSDPFVASKTLLRFSWTTLRALVLWLGLVGTTTPAHAEPTSMLGQIAGGTTGFVVGYLTGASAYSVARAEECDQPDNCNMEVVLIGLMVIGPIGGVAGSIDGVIVARAAGRSTTSSVLLGAATSVVVGTSMVAGAGRLVNNNEGSAIVGPLAGLGAATVFVGTPLVATKLAQSTENQLGLAPMGPRGTLGLSATAKW